MTSTTYENPAAPESDLRRRGVRIGDLLFRGIAVAAALAATVSSGWIAFKVFDLAWPAIQDFGLSFVWTDAWDPVTNQFGALIFIYGTVVTSLIALLIATPLSIAIALFLTEIAPRKLAAPIATMVELLAAIPSVVLGLWGIIVFGPWVRDHLEPWIQDTPLGCAAAVLGQPSASGIFTAALVLTIMIIPITSAICRELFIRVPKDLTDGALALGSTRWESIRGVMFAYAAPASSRLCSSGSGGPSARRSPSTRRSGTAMPSRPRGSSRRLAREQDRIRVRRRDEPRAGVVDPLPRRDTDGDLARDEPRGAVHRDPLRARQESRMSELTVDPYDITVKSNGLRRRRIVERVFGVLAIGSAVIACGILVLVLGTLVVKGFSSLNLDFFTKARPLFGEQGGVADALVGSALIVGMAMLMAIPVAVLVAIYMSEYAGPKVARSLKVDLDVLNGVPAIVVGIFVFGILVVGHGQSAVYGAFALAILMLPMVARATQEILEVVPRSLRDASFALGVTKWRTTWSIVLPAAIGGILTGVVIAVARVAGETAPLLFTTSIAANEISTNVSHALPTLPVTIFVFSESPDPGEQSAAWAAALVLIAFVLVMNVLAKLFAGRKRRQLEGS